MNFRKNDYYPAVTVLLTVHNEENIVESRGISFGKNWAWARRRFWAFTPGATPTIHKSVILSTRISN